MAVLSVRFPDSESVSYPSAPRIDPPLFVRFDYHVVCLDI